MDDLKVKLARLSDVFLPREPLVSRRADKLKFVFESTSSGKREREVTLHAVKVSNEAEVLFECLCHESESMKSFRLTRICSAVEYEGKSYEPAAFLIEGLGIPEEQCREAVQTAYVHTHIRNNFDRFLGESLADAAPLWAGNAGLEFKFKGKKQSLTLKNVFLLGEDDHYLWGYSETAGAFIFVPVAAIEGKITADGQGYQKKTFLPKFLGLA